ncbi:metallophosphoesterase [Sphingomonas sp. DBB INV C78]|uniref:metallophosphoesterase family protein n=1 Tax=Sphingomonas sp. DBB INV C78 TaxID=3349434 RepID=UPI0036D37CAE
MAATRLFHISDLHFGREDAVAVAWFADRVRAERPDAVIVTGDLTMRARSREFEAATEWLLALDVPVSIEPGNHDLPYFNPIARMTSPYGRFRKLERALERPLDLPGIWLVPLRTTTRAQWRFNWSWGVVRRRAIAEAVERLRACPPDHLAIVACHHPLIGSEVTAAHGETLRGQKALEAITAAGADAVLSGHVHQPFDSRFETAAGSVRLIGAGTLSERQRDAPPSFNELRVEQGGLDVMVRTMA